MSLNSFIKYNSKGKDRPIIIAASPLNIVYTDSDEYRKPYVLNYVLLSSLRDVTPYTECFETYRQAYRFMNKIRTRQGFKSLPPLQTYKG